jgi:hypothetical protein
MVDASAAFLNGALLRIATGATLIFPLLEAAEQNDSCNHSLTVQNMADELRNNGR